MRLKFIILSVLSLILASAINTYWTPVPWILVTLSILFIIGLYDMYQTKHTLWRNFPIVGRGRWLMEMLRPPMQQYFVESDIDGAPLSRMFRSVVYQRSKRVLDTVPFGTKVNVYRVGYEWMEHSMIAQKGDDLNPDPRVIIGGRDCKKPYSSSLLNISAMSFGALSKNAILSLNGGAKIDGFAHNTGEGGLSPYHLKEGGDLIWQVGTGYFGCRDQEGKFSQEIFRENALKEQIKMIEIKLSQGAKPGHGGILPAGKNTPEIAAIRGVEPYTRVDSPPSHSTFSTPLEMMAFIQQLRDLSDGKPIGFKLAVGIKSEFVALCKAMIKTGVKPDFITVDGGEGGTGAAPLEHTNSVGMPLRDGLAFVTDCLRGFDLKKEIRVIASGKILTGFHILKNLALGADLCASARGMMLALGCIQSLECNTNNCPVGVATQNPKFVKGLVIADKKQRVANFHLETIRSVVELLAASGLTETSQLTRGRIVRRVSQSQVKRYDEIYPYVQKGSFLKGKVPISYQKELSEATEDSFQPTTCILFQGEELTALSPIREGDL